MAGSFRIQRLLGQGGMGTVYLAEHPIIGSKVAIKFLHESMCTDPELVGRFYDEARSVNLVGHENIVAIYDLAQLANRYYIVMEYLDGAPLSQLLRGGRLPCSTAIDILSQLADALRAAHERGVVHRDLKPDNVFLLRRHGREHFVKLVDFGIAKLADRQSGARTAAGSIVGTPEYMAPEQCGDGHVDARTDVYSLGVMAYEIATGRLPFTGRIPQILLAHLTETPIPPRQIDPSVPVALERTILKALAKRPEDRFADMAAFATELELARGTSSPPASGTTEVASPAPLLEIEVRGPGKEVRRARACEVMRGGIFLRESGTLPALFSRVQLALPLSDGGAITEVAGDVVRHVTATEAARWNMAPGFAVQLRELGPAHREALRALAAQLAAPARAAPEPAPLPAQAMLEDLERRAATGPYELLGARPDAGFPEIRERARGLRREIDSLRPRLAPEQQAGAILQLLSRLDAAIALLGSPGERLMFDARRGNFHGVAHCVTAGTPAAVIATRRRALLAERPEQQEQAQRHLARAQVAAKLGNEDAALAEYEAALKADPLDLALHQRYWELRRGREVSS
ncbi:MAG TPA: serine/threonine-protein kinase [Anaeromyxobacteraceae bacterium]|nr:serine/threonine-protein kinase [Anaeromyxobacteraceae bacterium]